jgi:SAM-dependent methyltransferase
LTTAQDHYERMLAEHYTWMFGMPYERKVEEQTALLTKAGVGSPGLAVDLGCGSGFQTMALLGLGATHVHAIDTSAALLNELEGCAQGHPLTTHQADLMAFDQVIGAAADTIVCMGDTLTHLASKGDVTALFSKITNSLSKGGRLVLSWRDLSRPPTGLARLIPLRSTNDRMMFCFLEDQGETVLVHDLVHVKRKHGWQFQVGAYPKLKLSPDWVRVALIQAGLEPDHEYGVSGMTVVAATG